MTSNNGVPEKILSPETAEQFEHFRTNPELLKKDPDAEIWDKWQGAVLLKDEIRRYCQAPIKMIIPFEDTPACLKPSSYHLRLGNKYRVNGKDFELSVTDPFIKIPPHGIAIVRTLEWLNIPGFLVGRWNLKVKMVYKGLIWVGSLQVDSGYQGFLFCPLYNLSNMEQTLEYEDPIFTIDFVRTTRFDENEGSELWHSKRPTFELGALDTLRLTSAPAEQFKKMREELENTENKVDNFQSRIDSFQAITFTVLGIIVAAISFIGVSQITKMDLDDPSIWQIITWITFMVSLLSLTGVLVFAGIKILRRK